MSINKRGGIGSLIAMFMAIIVIVIILSGFTFMAGVWKAFAEDPAGVNVVDEDGIDRSFFDYMDNNSLNEVRFLVADGKGLDDAFLEAFPGGVDGKW